ncbi:MAG: hypothetical protein ACKOVA_06775 [Novosphingobium sp.]
MTVAAFSAPTSAQQATSEEPAGSGSATRGVIILKAEPKPAPVPAPVAPRPAPPPPVMPPQCERPFAKADIRTSRYGNDAARFDRDLARKLNGARQNVSVDISAPWPAEGDPPAMIGRWLEEVKASGGKITVNEYCRKSRGFFSFFNKLFQRKPVDRLEAVRNYDAVLQINGADQAVTQVLFRRRPAP